MRAFIKITLLLLLATPLRAQDAGSAERVRFLQDSLEAVFRADSLRAEEFNRLEARERLRGERETFWVQTGVLAGAAIFCIWAALYKKRYREQFTVNGRYIGIGSRYYHDHFETDHYDPDHDDSWLGPGVRPQDDPWCFQKHLDREARLRDQQRRAREARKGGGASTTW